MKYNEITLDDVKKYLQVDFAEDDNIIEMLMLSAKGYIKTATKTPVDQWEEIPEELTQVLLYLVSLWYEQRIPIGQVTAEIQMTVSMLLNPHNMGGVM